MARSYRHFTLTVAPRAYRSPQFTFVFPCKCFFRTAGPKSLACPRGLCYNGQVPSRSACRGVKREAGGNPARSRRCECVRFSWAAQPQPKPLGKPGKAETVGQLAQRISQKTCSDTAHALPSGIGPTMDGVCGCLPRRKRAGRSLLCQGGPHPRVRQRGRERLCPALCVAPLRLRTSDRVPPNGTERNRTKDWTKDWTEDERKTGRKRHAT